MNPVLFQLSSFCHSFQTLCLFTEQALPMSWTVLKYMCPWLLCPLSEKCPQFTAQDTLPYSLHFETFPEFLKLYFLPLPLYASLRWYLWPCGDSPCIPPFPLTLFNSSHPGLSDANLRAFHLLFILWSKNFHSFSLISCKSLLKCQPVWTLLSSHSS